MCAFLKKKKKSDFESPNLISTYDSSPKSQLIIYINPRISAVMATERRATVTQMRIKKPERLFLQSEALLFYKGANTDPLLLRSNFTFVQYDKQYLVYLHYKHVNKDKLINILCSMYRAGLGPWEIY